MNRWKRVYCRDAKCAENSLRPLRLCGELSLAAFTLVELLVVIAIIAVLMSLLFPAVQKVREASNRLICGNNLRNLGVAVHNYENGYRELPPGGVDVYERGEWVRTHGWGPYLLPYLEQNALYNRYHWDARWRDSINQPVVAFHLKVMQCPSAEPDRIGELKAAAGDYGVLNSIHPKVRKDGLMEYVQNLDGAMWVVGEDYAAAPRIGDIADGTSFTIIIAEDAGRPQLWRAGELILNKKTDGAGWADRDNCFDLDGYSSDGNTRFGPCAINCTNANEVYSFHPGGAHLLFADGAVHFVGADMNIRVLAALITRAGGEIVAQKDFAD